MRIERKYSAVSTTVRERKLIAQWRAIITLEGLDFRRNEGTKEAAKVRKLSHFGSKWRLLYTSSSEILALLQQHASRLIRNKLRRLVKLLADVAGKQPSIFRFDHLVNLDDHVRLMEHMRVPIHTN